ncbi:serine hydrolase domain-containing protein [Aquimarina spongiae]|uniref:CubicO group peptidase, beta-lactamase class C family n=1 Tax=Aquimarina spongiae TaxID=570521 RepID=A0A1M6I4U7_9FLAO|nr:serine hydrolase domain-containing protein [Aquimarina spongiae]SHJ29420.1 CubicO group peptidase, beta-lactamase class C family [Aquimarina spongiae]
MKHLLSLTFLAILCSITFTCTAQSYVKKADSLFYIHEQENGPGLSIIVSKNGEPLYKNHTGFSNIEHQIPINDDTRFLVGSISKQFTVFSMLLLEQQNKLSIDDPITKYLPELKALPHQITIRMLANHTNGFRNNTDLNGLRGRSDQDLIGQREMVFLLLRQRGLNFEPGERFQYNNAGYVLLAEIVTRVSGIPFQEFVRERIFKPLNMTSSQFINGSTSVITKKANSYYKNKDKYHYYPMNRSIVGSTGLYTTTQDLIKWTQIFVDSKLGSPAIISKMIQPSTLNSGEKIPYGLGLETKNYRGVKVIFHGGGDAAFRAYLLHIPEHNFTVAVAGNYESFNPLTIAYGMIDVFLEQSLTPKTTPSNPKPTKTQLEAYTGTYQVFPGFYIHIKSRRDSLFLQPHNTTNEVFLPVISENSFQFTPRQHSKLVFGKDELLWHFSDFSYPAKKVTLTPIDNSQIQIEEYLGTFYNDELQTTYTFVKKGEKIIAKHAFNSDVELVPIDKDSFITDSSILGRVDFERNEQNIIISCKISGQTAYNIPFIKYRE